MRLLFKHTAKLTAILFATLFFTGCIGDDMSDCFPDKLNLRFVYDYNKDFRDKFNAQVETLDLFIYDKESNELLDSVHVKKADLAAGNIHALQNLPAANAYMVVVWGNLNPEFYDCQGHSVYSGMKVELRSNALGLVAKRQGSLFHGKIEFEAGTTGEIVVSLVKDTNDIHLIIKDEDDNGGRAATYAAAQGQFTAQITADNGAYKYDNTPIAGYKQIYQVATTILDSGNPSLSKADLTVMRLFVGDDSKITIQDTKFSIPITDDKGNPIKNMSLTELLMKDENINSNEMLDRYDDYTLYFETKVLKGAVVMALVRINDWTLIYMGGGTGGR